MANPTTNTQNISQSLEKEIDNLKKKIETKNIIIKNIQDKWQEISKITTLTRQLQTILNLPEPNNVEIITIKNQIQTQIQLPEILKSPEYKPIPQDSIAIINRPLESLGTLELNEEVGNAIEDILKPSFLNEITTLQTQYKEYLKQFAKSNEIDFTTNDQNNPNFNIETREKQLENLEKKLALIKQVQKIGQDKLSTKSIKQIYNQKEEEIIGLPSSQIVLNAINEISTLNNTLREAINESYPNIDNKFATDQSFEKFLFNEDDKQPNENIFSEQIILIKYVNNLIENDRRFITNEDQKFLLDLKEKLNEIFKNTKNTLFLNDNNNYDNQIKQIIEQIKIKEKSLGETNRLYNLIKNTNEIPSGSEDRQLIISQDANKIIANSLSNSVANKAYNLTIGWIFNKAANKIDPNRQIEKPIKPESCIILNTSINNIPHVTVSFDQSKTEEIQNYGWKMNLSEFEKQCIGTSAEGKPIEIIADLNQPGKFFRKSGDKITMKGDGLFIDLNKETGIDIRIISDKNGNLIICRSNNSIINNTQELENISYALNKLTLEINGKKIDTIIDNILKHTVGSKIDNISIGHIAEKPATGLTARI